LRRVSARFLPEDLLDRPKMGFGIPVGDWLRGPLRGWAEELLEPSLLTEGGYFVPEEVARTWATHRSGEDDLMFQLWPILMFQAWLTEARP